MITHLSSALSGKITPTVKAVAAREGIDPEKIRTFRKERSLTDDVCSMRGEYCAMKIVTEYFKK